MATPDDRQLDGHTRADESTVAAPTLFDSLAEAGSDDLAARTAAFLDRALAPQTRRAYARAMTDFTAWCAAHGRTPIPATSETVASYAVALAEQGKSPSTISQAINAIKQRHRAAGFDAPDDYNAGRVVHVHKRDRARKGEHAKKSDPLIDVYLRRIVASLDLDTPIGLRDRAMLVIGRDMFARRSELAERDIEDLRIRDDRLTIWLGYSKTDQTGNGTLIELPRHPERIMDPVDAALDWLAWLESQDVTEGPFLRQMNSAGTRVMTHHRAKTERARSGRLDEQSINLRIKKLAKAAGVPGHITAHSLRSGGATQARMDGATVEEIADHGRWLRGSVALWGYMHVVDKWEANPLRKGERARISRKAAES